MKKKITIFPATVIAFLLLTLTGCSQSVQTPDAPAIPPEITSPAEAAPTETPVPSEEPTMTSARIHRQYFRPCRMRSRR